MANTQNDNLIEMSSNELVRYINKFKVISKYDDKKYESNEVELINPALENLEVKILDPVKDEDEITLTAVVENGDSNQTYNYQWFIYKEDGETELPYGLGTDTAIAHIEDLDELEQFCLVSVAAYTAEGLFAGISDIKTIYKDTEDITSPVIIDLSNDSATIPADLVSSDITDDAKLFQELTVTYLTVLRGDEDITNVCDINWQASSNDVEFIVSEDKRTVCITAMPAILKAASLTVTVEYPKALTENQTGTLTAKYNIIRAGEGVTLYQLQLPQKVINTTYFTDNETYTYSYRVKKCSGRHVTWLTQDQLDAEDLEVVWGYKEAQDVDLEDYTWEPTIDGTFEYQIGTHTGLHIVLRSKNENDLAKYYDSEIISFVKDGGVFTDLVLSANSPNFNVDANGNFAQEEVVLTASLYGELEGKESLIEWEWSLGDIPSGAISEDRKTFTLKKANMANNNAIEVTATINLNGEDYYDKMTIYKLKNGSSAITAFLTNQCINFSANADGVVNTDNNTHISKVRVFRGSEDISDLVDVVTAPEIVPEGMNIVIESITENNKQFKQIKIGIAEGVEVNLGGTGSCDGELEFNITLTGSEAEIPLTLSWSKNNAGKDGAAGLNGTSPYTIQLDNDSDIIVKSSNGDWFVDDTNMAIVVNVACYMGDQKDNTVTANDCQCNPPSPDWTNGCYTWDGEVLKITKVPDNFISGYFTFSWIKSGVTLATKNFSLSSTIALADYDLIIPQVVYNVDNVKTGETFAISVLKKSKDKIETLTSRGSEKIKILGPTGEEVTDWGVVPVPQAAGNYTYTLKSTTATNLTWDEEVLTTVSNGIDGLGYTGVQLVAPGQVFVRDPNTNAITPNSIKLTAKLSGDLKGQTLKLKWYKDGAHISSNDGKSEFEVASSNLSEDKKQVTYKVKVDDGNANDNDDYDDEFSLYLVTEGVDGDDAYSAWLSDQSWSFTGDENGYVTKNVTKSTTVKIYRGGEEVTSGISITSTTKDASSLKSGGVFGISGAILTFTTNNSDENNLCGVKNADGTIDIKAKLEDKEFDLVLSWDKVSTGDSGGSGRGITQIIEKYQTTVNNNSAELSSSSWKDSVADTGFNETNKYLWNYEIIEYTSAPLTETTEPAMIAIYSKDGRGINSIANYYLINDGAPPTKPASPPTADAPTDAAQGQKDTWYKTPPYPTDTYRYLWNIEAITYSDSGTPIYTDPAVISIKGEKGSDSTVPGPGIDKEIRVYQWSKTTPATGGNGWVEVNELGTYNLDKADKFLWTCYKQTWTDNRTPTYTAPIRMTDYEMGTLMASLEGLTIAQWCQEYGRTLIDGSTIVSGSIKTDQLDANAVTADKIAADAVTATKIKIDDYADIADAKIAGWEIAEDRIDKKDSDGNSVVCMSSGNDSYESLVNNSGTSPIRFYAGGLIKTVEVEEIITSNGQIFTYSPSDCKKILSAKYRAAGTGGGCGFDGIGTDTLTATWSGANSGTLTITYTYEPLNFIVLEDGSLYASAADITGAIHAREGEFEGTIIAHNGGKIGDLKIQSGGLESDLIQLNHTGLRLTGGEVAIGANNDVVINTQTEKGVWDTASQGIESVVFSSRTNKPFVIKNSGGAGIYFSNVTAQQTGEIKYSIKTDMEYKLVNGRQNGGYLYFKYSIENNDVFLDNHTVLLFMRLHYNNIGNSDIYLNLTIPAHSNSGLCTITNLGGTTVGDNTLGFENNRVVFPTSPSGNFASGQFYQTVKEWGGAVEGPYVDFGNFASLDGDRKIFDYVYTPYQVNNNVLYSLGSFFPSKEQLSLGESHQPWDKIYSSSGTVQSSDIRLKNSIQPLSNSYEIFYDQINPVLYRLNNGTSNRLHAGFIAQEIEKALNNANISTKDFAGVCIGQDEQKTRGIRYEEFVSLNTWQIQKLKKRAEEDEQTIARQAETIAQLEERLTRIESLLEKNP